ncbi:MAG: Na+/H+ antiporter subunit E [Bauldia sp.]|nr:MAG: Na+/H+ antiporter subunit E [Bauldia sp.]
MRVVSLAIALFVFWILLSGHVGVFLLASGAVAAILVALVGVRVGYADDEGHPAELILPGLRYWPWLAKEIVKSTIDVARIILNPALPISPRLIVVRPSQKTAVGVVTYANSITLTPGTITVEVDRRDRRFIVHALTEASAAGVESGDMDRHVTAFEGKR